MRLVAADTLALPGMQHRSITDSLSAASKLSSHPTDSKKDPRRLAAYKNAFARSTDSGAAAAESSLAKRVTAGDALRGLNPAIAWSTVGGRSSATVHILWPNVRSVRWIL